MIKIKEFIRLTNLTPGDPHPDNLVLADELNEFIEENNIKDLIDFKTNKQFEFNRNGDLYVLNSVTIVYREVK